MLVTGLFFILAASYLSVDRMADRMVSLLMVFRVITAILERPSPLETL